MTEPSPESASTRGYLRPGQWGPVVGFLIAVVVSLSTLLVLGFGGDEQPPDVIIKQCAVGEPGCELRQAVHWHADFAVFLEGTQHDFNDPRYLVEDAEDARENLHLHATRFSVLHAHREQSSWDEFFSSIGWKLSDSCIVTADDEEFCNTSTSTLKFVVNGVRIDSLQFEFVSDLSRVLISYGDETDEQVIAQYALVSDQACIASELCLDRVPPGGNTEPCVGKGTCN